MNSLNASSVGNRQKWRTDVGFKNLFSQEALKEPAIWCCGNPVLTSTVCCSRTDCDKVKVEHVQERLFRRNPGNTLFSQLNTTYPACCMPSATSGKNETVTVIPDYPAFCPCVIGRAHLVTYCCVRRDCDDATKIGGNRESAFSHFKY